MGFNSGFKGLRTKAGSPLLLHIRFSTHKEHFVGAFTDLRKTTIISAMYLCLPVWKNS